MGAILTQSTAWSNVEKEIQDLKKANALSPQAIRDLPLPELSKLIHSCGYYNAKAIKLKAFAGWFERQYGNSLKNLCSTDLDELRKELLEVHGIGEETADSILLYACEKPIFVIDAYTRRVIDCLGLNPKNPRYSEYQALFMKNLPHDVQMFNEFHALFVALGKETCRRGKPLCEACCLKDRCRLGIKTIKRTLL